jgi:hypothetical protein
LNLLFFNTFHLRAWKRYYSRSERSGHGAACRPKVADYLYEGITRQSYGEPCELVQLAVSGQAETRSLTDEQIN